MPKGHKARDILDGQSAIPDFLETYRNQYRLISIHRSTGFSAAEPLLHTLDIYDRKMGIDREPYETEILITLDALDRTAKAKRDEKTGDKATRGDRR